MFNATVAPLSKLEIEGVPAVGGLKFSLAQKRFAKSASWGKCQLEELPVGRSASWGKCQLGDFNLSDFLGTIFILIHFYLINAHMNTIFKLKFIQ